MFLEIWESRNGNNDTLWSNPAYDALLRKALAAVNLPALPDGRQWQRLEGFTDESWKANSTWVALAERLLGIYLDFEARSARPPQADAARPASAWGRRSRRH